MFVVLALLGWFQVLFDLGQFVWVYEESLRDLVVPSLVFPCAQLAKSCSVVREWEMACEGLVMVRNARHKVVLIPKVESERFCVIL